jgi:hypothetical protein
MVLIEKKKKKEMKRRRGGRKKKRKKKRKKMAKYLYSILPPYPVFSSTLSGESTCSKLLYLLNKQLFFPLPSPSLLLLIPQSPHFLSQQFPSEREKKKKMWYVYHPHPKSFSQPPPSLQLPQP